MFLADFHIHSTFSDGQLTIPEIVDLYGSHGFGAIAITDHLAELSTLVGKCTLMLDKTLTPQTFPQYQKVLQSEMKRAWKRYGMLLIPGYEVTKNAIRSQDTAHFLALGMTDYLSADQNVDVILQQVQGEGGLTVAAHPVHTGKIEHQSFYLWRNRDYLSQWMDAWEVAAGKRLFTEVEESGLPILADSDMHARRHFTSWKTVLDCPRSQEEVFRAIRAQDLSYSYYKPDTDEAEPTEPLLLAAGAAGATGAV